MSLSKPGLKSAVFFFGGVVLGGLITFGLFFNRGKKFSIFQKEIDFQAFKIQPYFKLDDKEYTSNNLPQVLSMNAFRIESNIYNQKKAYAEQSAGIIAIAAENGLKLDQLKTEEDLQKALKIQPPSDTDALTFYNRLVSARQVNPAQTPFSAVKNLIVNNLKVQNTNELVLKKAKELEANGRLSLSFSAPDSPVVNLDTSAYPWRGNQNAAVTFVEVADYLCPHCREAEPLLEKLSEQYKQSVKFVHVSFPLREVGLNAALAKGAYCAQKQSLGSFWAYHKQAFLVPYTDMEPKNGENPEVFFSGVAGRVAQLSGLNQDQFNSCLASPEAQESLKKTRALFNESSGFQGTPTFYLNGRLVPASSLEEIETTLKKVLSP